MYRNYVLKRVAYGVLMFVVMIFTYSALFNTVTDQTMRSQIEEQIVQEMIRYKNMDPDQLQTLKAERRNEKIRQYRLDKPVVERIFFRGLEALTFNFGQSTIMRSARGDRSVAAIVAERIPRTLMLFLTQVIIVLVLGVMLGLLCARKPNGVLDRATSTITMITNGLPSWWLGMLMIMAFVYAIPIFPTPGFQSIPAPEGILGVLDIIWHMLLPIFTLVLLGVWGVGYLVRNIVLGNLQEDYVMAARARGIPEHRVIFGHTLRSSMPAILTLAVLSLFSSISGNIIVEGIFSWPGIGNLYFEAVSQNDVPVLMGTLSIQTLVNMIGFVSLDIVYGLVDPRIKVGGKAV